MKFWNKLIDYFSPIRLCREWRESKMRNNCTPDKELRGIAEPFNAWSNLAYIAGGAIMLMQKTPESIIFFLSMLSLGIGSFLYHAIPSRRSAYLDHFGIYAVFSTLLLLAVEAPFYMVAIISWGFAYQFSHILQSNLNMTTVAVGIMAFLAIGMNPYTLIGLGFIGLAFIAWTLDLRTIVLGRYGHAIWHLGTAIGITLMFVGAGCGKGDIHENDVLYGYGSKVLHNATGVMQFNPPVTIYHLDKIHREYNVDTVTSNIQHVLDNSTSYTEIFRAVLVLHGINPVSFKPATIREVVFTNRMNPYLPYIQEAATTFDIDPNIIKAIIVQESNANPLAQSRVGAKGLMQLMDDTAQYMGVENVWNPYENIMGGTGYFREMLDRFGNIRLALAAYNAGPVAVNRFRGIPPYRETREYVVKVLEFKHYFDTQTQPALYAYLN